MGKNHNRRLMRILEIAPGALSWSIIAFFVVLAIWKPVYCAVLIIVFDFYWIIRTIYLTTLLLLANRQLAKQRRRPWFRACQKIPAWEQIYQLVIFPVYKEGPDILRPSLEALRHTHYARDRMIVVLAFEERHGPAREYGQILAREYEKTFGDLLVMFHPDRLPGEKRLKGANATWAAKRSKEYFQSRGVPLERVIVSCFDADTCVDREYFGCLAYHFLTVPQPHQASYQPVPVYNNNIWYAPAFARIIETSASFCQMIESMRIEKFVTFSSHSMSFRTLVDIDYWPVDMISDDSVVYWKAFLHFNGAYRVVPLYTTVSMDAAYSSSFFKTLWVQYKQKRRWAWGVENFAFLVSRLLKNRHIPAAVKMRRSFQLLESHVTWATWAIIIGVIGSLPMLLGGRFFAQSAIGYNLPRITGLLFDFTLYASLVWIVLSWTILPPRPKDVPWSRNLVMAAEWLIVPAVIVLLGSTPALDAQTRLMFGRYMEFSATEKTRKVV
ncbi:MAG TPA: glycosyltransferase family 2 protein [Candidatus Omnitrophota bacterium]|nr:glycosyltransferase family 2 protein [Candidatus Omnitrophota bacterium]HQO37757.1 glycosyltransferase family 2 protein [Candidatus Omnitrophota bacterium]HQQ05856.1 glycosyltransferase family 2 protein [Candidatus Omnitrophota bacterium]